GPVMEQHELLYPGVEREGNRILVRRVSPALVPLVLVRGIRRVVNEHLRPTHETLYLFVPFRACRIGVGHSHFIVRDIDERRSVFVPTRKAVSQSAARM